MKYFLQSLFYAVLISVFILLTFSILFLLEHGSIQLQFFKSQETVMGLSRGVSLGLLGNYMAFGLQKLIPGDHKLGLRYGLYVLLAFILVPIVVLIVDLIVLTDFTWEAIRAYVSKLHWYSYLGVTLIAILIGSVFYLIYYYNRYKNRQIKKQQKIAGEATAQLETLKNQIDPHFLFNSLNVLIGLIEEDQNNAIIYTRSLSNIYRYILEHKDQELTIVADEMAFARSYISLLRLRFENAIVYEESLDIPKDLKIPPLSLQLLLENCIQHNRISEEKPLHIHIFTEKNKLVVANNLQEKSIPTNSTKIGLKNIVERYALLGKEEVVITKTEAEFMVKLPLLT